VPRDRPDGRHALARPPTIAAGIAFIASSWLHLWRLGTEGVVVDENLYRAAGIEYIHGLFRRNLQHPPLAKELIGGAAVLFHGSWGGVRLPSALAGLATGAVLYLWARRVSGPWAGVAAIALWGMVPQRAGMPEFVNLGIATRVDRFALLDPVATAFVALALWMGWEWMTTRSILSAGAAGIATGFAAASKAPGFLVAFPIVAFAVWSGYRHLWPLARQLAGYVAGGLLAVGVAYAPLGIHGAFHQLHFMFARQAMRQELGHTVYLAGRIFRHPPWWAGLAYQTYGFGWALTVVGVVLIVAAVALIRPRASIAYALTAAITTYLALNLATGLQLPFYYVLWQPGLVLAAAVGADALRDKPRGRFALIPIGVAAAVPIVALYAHVATLGPGPYERAARLAQCHERCEADVVGYSAVLSDYLPRGWIVRRGLPVGATPDLVISDPTVTIRRPDLAVDVAAWAATAPQLGYRSVSIDGLRIWFLPEP
jgi:4-amino-4-deoxy-L-arabinose transferase-like glycosyltransferase